MEGKSTCSAMASKPVVVLPKGEQFQNNVAAYIVYILKYWQGSTVHNLTDYKKTIKLKLINFCVKS